MTSHVMTTEKLISLLRDPGSVDVTGLPSLMESAEKHPYCSTLRLLSLIGLNRERHPDFLQQLKISAAVCGSRARMKELLSEFHETVKPAAEKKTISEPVEETIPVQEDSGLPEKEETPVRIPEIALINENERAALLAVVKKRLEEIRAEKMTAADHRIPVPEEPAGQKRSLSREEIIERFIREEPRISAPRAEFYSPSESAIRSNLDDAGIVSETLAILCAEQGEKQRAIRIYERLSLLYPEKSVYFAAQIKKLHHNS